MLTKLPMINLHSPSSRDVSSNRKELFYGNPTNRFDFKKHGQNAKIMQDNLDKNAKFFDEDRHFDD